MGSLAEQLNQASPFLGVILLQFGFVGMSIITKSALNIGMSQHVLVVYRNIVATIVIAPFAIIFDRKVRPRMTFSIFIKIALLGLLEPTIDQNLYYTGMKYTTATFTVSMNNILPAFAFLMAWICRLEKVNIRKLHSQAKISGTIVTVGGAMLMTLVKGPMLNLPWTKEHNSHHQESTTSATKHDPIKGALMITIGCFCWSGFIILQAITLRSYPAELSLTALICFMGAIQGTVLAVAMEWGNASAWAINLDYKLLAAVYGGLVCSGVTYYIQGAVMKNRGPVFVTAFSPLAMVVVAIMGSFLLGEILYLGRIIGAIVIVFGLYLVLWGKSKDQTPSEGKEAMIDKQIDTTSSDQEFVTIDVTTHKELDRPMEGST
ncbi:WAT1-related protein At2g39510-like [Tripterygium wilfordii]|uniref:WAT1-related protein At2g39510-like n=1 Tax=Tripterygium wilfordii TaxID=458696 RepID=UPI0018F7F126|nr:WAT1-related protein At2g39510-like [Tripterygium wilfordii]